MITALVTGIGGTRSIAVMNALRKSGESVRIIGTDANYFNAGSFQCDASYIVPLVSDPAYLPELESIIRDEKIDIIFATVEKEVLCLSKNKQYLEKTYGVAIIVPDEAILEICFDKYKTQEFLLKNGFSAIPCIYGDNRAAIESFVQENGLPIIRKPVFGYGSKGLSVISNADEVSEIELDKDYVLQKFIENSDTETYYNTSLNEYTAEIFINDDYSVAGGIIIKRALRAGETVAGYLVKNQRVIDNLSRVAEELRIKGPCNFQYRVSDGEIYIFEINPLFSGTTLVRANFGFNSVNLALQSFVKKNHTTISQDELKEQYFLRYLSEIYISPEDFRNLNKDGFIKNG